MLLMLLYLLNKTVKKERGEKGRRKTKTATLESQVAFAGSKKANARGRLSDFISDRKEVDFACWVRASGCQTTSSKPNQPKTKKCNQPKRKKCN